MPLEARYGLPSFNTMTGLVGSGSRSPGLSLAICDCWNEAESGIETPSTKMPVVPQPIALIEWKIDLARFARLNKSLARRRSLRQQRQQSDEMKTNRNTTLHNQFPRLIGAEIQTAKKRRARNGDLEPISSGSSRSRRFMVCANLRCFDSAARRELLLDRSAG